jgi:hypothetical protein
MSENIKFGRAYELIIGPKNGTQISIKDLRVSFAIDKNLEKYPNNSQFQIYNLSSKTRSFVEKENGIIILRAGYGETLKGIFIGDIVTVTHKQDGPDIITTIEAGDGLSGFMNGKIDISFAPGATNRNILDVITNATGFAQGSIVGLNQGKQYLNGTTLSGPVSKHLDDITSQNNAEWSIQNGQLQIIPRNGTTENTAILLNKENGLIGTPYKNKIINVSLLSKKDGKTLDAGIHCVSLLNGDINPGSAIKIESRFLNGIFKVVQVKHFGDNYGQPWYSEIGAREYN